MSLLALRNGISQCSSYVCLGREVRMTYGPVPELSRRKRAAWEVFKSVEDVAKKTKNVRLCDHLFDSTVLPVLTYASVEAYICEAAELPRITHRLIPSG